MFLRIFSYKIKQLIRMPWIVGWNFLFPLVLASAFYLGFGNMIKDDPNRLDTIEVAYVAGDGINSNFLSVIKELSKETKDHGKILEVTSFDSLEAASDALNKKDIEGIYYEHDDSIEVIVTENGLISTSLSQIVKSYQNYQASFEKILSEKPEAIDALIASINSNMSFLKKYDFKSGVSQYMQFFYALLAMSSLFSSWVSTAMMTSLCANLSECGKRFEMAPGHKLKAIFAGILAGTLLQSISNTVVICYVEYCLGLHWGAPIYMVIAITSLASALGISIGTLIGSIFKNEMALSMVPLAFTMTCSFFSGLMMGGIQQIIKNFCPILNKINPATVFTDSLYQLACYGKTSAYYQDLGIMVLMIAICLIISVLILRRRNYDSL
ncbi:ABC transporter permease [Lachnospira pectinoschiza]|uniref:ABC-2 type transport system permease protein n=1 Tax=Lachnospira pectinoschiza TaxID=28052 RepID=A0A1G9TC63_9FIRM|nr:ABC transporter permease [Lachnospira pectinoschiza]SDM45349.1 ABC-2 type transport system permease protein [Lachnospira pectinoschiza]